MSTPIIIALEAHVAADRLLADVPPMNLTQMNSLYRKFNQDADGSETFLAFLIRVQLGYDCLMIKWCGMWLGIETDGHTHS